MGRVCAVRVCACVWGWCMYTCVHVCDGTGMVCAPACVCVCVRRDGAGWSSHCPE